MNAGVSGDTSAGGLRRLEWSLDGDAAMLVVALGGNDGAARPAARRLAAQSRRDRRARPRRAGVRVILAGMEAPPNNGAEYTARVPRRSIATSRARHDVRFMPFLLDGVAGDPALNQADGIHPNRRGPRGVADTVWRGSSRSLRALEGSTTE